MSELSLLLGFAAFASYWSRSSRSSFLELQSDWNDLPFDNQERWARAAEAALAEFMGRVGNRGDQTLSLRYARPGVRCDATVNVTLASVETHRCSRDVLAGLVQEVAHNLADLDVAVDVADFVVNVPDVGSLQGAVRSDACDGVYKIYWPGGRGVGRLEAVRSCDAYGAWEIYPSGHVDWCIEQQSFRSAIESIVNFAQWAWGRADTHPNDGRDQDDDVA